jgi:neutral ceramidase
VAKDLLFDANINRSPSSYLLNPQSERDEFATLGDTDKEMLQLKFTRSDGEPVGLLNWFAVHGTSMNASNLVRTHYITNLVDLEDIECCLHYLCRDIFQCR